MRPPNGRILDLFSPRVRLEKEVGRAGREYVGLVQVCATFEGSGIPLMSARFPPSRLFDYSQLFDVYTTTDRSIANRVGVSAEGELLIRIVGLTSRRI